MRKPTHKKIKNIIETMDYDAFKLLSYNRELVLTHVETVKESIKANDLTNLKPIIVNEGMEIIDGQYRFEACRQLGLPIFYVVNNNGKHNHDNIICLNISQKNWRAQDYAFYYAQRGNQNYVKLLNFVTVHGITYDAAQIICSNHARDTRSFKKGRFLFSKEEYACKVMEIISLLCQLKFRKAKESRCVIGLDYVMRVPGFKIRHLKKKIIAFPTKLVPCVSRREFSEMFVDLYNYHSAKNSLIFLPKERK